MTARGSAVWLWTAGSLLLVAGGLLALHLLVPSAAGVLRAGPGQLGDPVGDLGVAAPLASLAANALTVVVPLPGTSVAMLNGALFGPWSGAFLNWAGGLAGAVLCFWLGRRILAPHVARLVARRPGAADSRARRRVRLLARRLERPSGGGVAVARLAGAPFGLVSYLGGATAVGWWPFLWGTAAGSLPRAAGYAALGSAFHVPFWLGLAMAPAAGAAWAGWRLLTRRRGSGS